MYNVDTFTVHESIQYTHQKTRGINILPGDLPLYSGDTWLKWAELGDRNLSLQSLWDPGWWRLHLNICFMITTVGWLNGLNSVPPPISCPVYLESDHFALRHGHSSCSEPSSSPAWIPGIASWLASRGLTLVPYILSSPQLPPLFFEIVSQTLCSKPCSALFFPPRVQVFHFTDYDYSLSSCQPCSSHVAAWRFPELTGTLPQWNICPESSLCQDYFSPKSAGTRLPPSLLQVFTQLSPQWGFSPPPW